MDNSLHRVLGQPAQDQRLDEATVPAVQEPAHWGLFPQESYCLTSPLADWFSQEEKKEEPGKGFWVVKDPDPARDSRKARVPAFSSPKTGVTDVITYSQRGSRVGVIT